MSKYMSQNDTEAIQLLSSGAAEGEVTRCSDEILRLRGVIELVEKHQARLNHEIFIHQSFIAPIHRLPPELLALIFSFFCTIDFWDDPFERMSDCISGSLFREPFIIATVCSHWRSIAVSTPSLWATIILGDHDIELSREEYTQYCYEEDDDCGFNDSQTFPEDILEVALQRSAQHPLKLWLQCFNNRPWPSIFTTKLCQVSSRIQQMNISGDSDPFDAANPVFDQLSAVKIGPTESDGMVRLPWLPTATNIRVLVIQNVDDAETGFWTSLPVKSTQFLLIEADAFTVTRKISTSLSKFTNVVSSVLKCRYSDYAHPLVCQSPRPLHYLSVDMTCFRGRCCGVPGLRCDPNASFERCKCIGNLLTSLTLPGLKGLQIVCHDPDHIPWSQKHFVAFMDRSVIAKTLTSFSVHGICDLNNKKLTKVLQCMPSLTRLIISAFENKPIIGTTMLARLAGNSTLALVPRLKIFDVRLDATTEVVDALVRLVEARSIPRGHLEKIVIRMETKELHDLAKRIEVGLKGFPGTRHVISEPISGYSNFDDWY
ncbi:hypothetical protein C8J56DRAFT_92729 [Mycena floridula]|nr:hypothetical protein C8J56DRAFT_92729 [Mycena floridula]